MRVPVLRGLLQALGGAASVGAVSLLRNVLIARTMGPAAFGLWNLCLVAMRLAAESHLGSLAAVAVEGPKHRGAGRDAEAAELERGAAAAALVFSALAGVVAALALRWVGGPPLSTAAALLALTVVLQQQFFADVTVERSRRRFGGISISQALYAAVYLTGLLALLPDYYLTGALLAGCGGLGTAIVAIRRAARSPLPRPTPAALRGLRELLRLGAPTYVVHLVFAVMLQADRLVVWLVLGPEDLGHYGVVLLGVAALLFVPDAFAGVLWPFAGESFGRNLERPEALRGMTVKAVRHLALFLAALLPAALGAMDVLVAVVLPNYTPALPALRPALAGAMALAVALPLRNVAMTIGAGSTLVRAQLVVLVVMVASQAAAASLGAGIAGVALAALASWALLLALLLRLLVSRGVLDGRAAARLGIETVVLLGAGLLLERALDAVAPSPASMPGALLRPGAPGMLAAAVALWALRGRREE